MPHIAAWGGCDHFLFFFFAAETTMITTAPAITESVIITGNKETIHTAKSCQKEAKLFQLDLKERETRSANVGEAAGVYSMTSFRLILTVE